MGSNWVNECAESGEDEHIALVGRDAHDVRAFMIEGPTGILPMAPPHFYPTYEPSKKLITWPNGCKAHIYYAEEPKTIRGPNHSKAWGDELASWQDAHKGDGEDTAWSNLMMTMRVGNPKVLITGTPKPIKLVKQLVRRPDVVVRRGNTYENKANLSKTFFDKVTARYEGTRLGRQELSGEILDDNPGALVSREWIEGGRMRNGLEEYDRIVVAIDPSVSGINEEESTDDVNMAKSGAEAGIIVAGKRGNQYYILDDRTPKKGSSPLIWAKEAIRAYEYWQADALIAEKNNGGEMVELVIRATEINGKKVGQNVHIKTVWASKGKQTRAEPVAALYEQLRIHHVGTFEALEDQWCEWEPITPDGKVMPSPDRLDACVWAITDLADLDQEIAVGSEEDYSNFWKREPGGWNHY